MLKQDYMMRTIHELVRTLLKLLFQADEDRCEDMLEQEDKQRYQQLMKKINDGDINGAENELLDGLDPGRIEDLRLALLFYERLNQKEDTFLQENDYSRDEVEEGIAAVMRTYGYDSLIGTLMTETEEEDTQW